MMHLITASFLMLTSFIISGYTQEYLVHELHWKHPIISSTLVSLSVVIPSFVWYWQQKRSPTIINTDATTTTTGTTTTTTSIPVVPLRVHFVIGIILWLSFYLTSLAPLYMSYPAFLACRAAKLIPTMIIGYLWLRKRYTMTDILGGCLATIGLICIVAVEYGTVSPLSSNPTINGTLHHNHSMITTESLDATSLTTSSSSSTLIIQSNTMIDIQHIDHHNNLPINDMSNDVSVPDIVPTIDTIYGTVTSPLPIPLRSSSHQQPVSSTSTFATSPSSSSSDAVFTSFFTNSIIYSIFQSIGYGPLVLLLGLFCDGIATNAQQALFEQYHGITSQEIGFYTMGISSLLSILYGTFVLPSNRLTITNEHTTWLVWDGGALYDGLHSFLFEDYRITFFVILYGIASYLSNIATLSILETAGAATASFISAICKAILVLISYTVFPKPISSIQIFGIVLIFGSIVTVTIGKKYTITVPLNESIDKSSEPNSPLSISKVSYPDIHASPLSYLSTPKTVSASSSPLSPIGTEKSTQKDNEYSVLSPPTVVRSSDSLYSLLQISRQSSEEKSFVSSKDPISVDTKDGLRFRGGSKLLPNEIHQGSPPKTKPRSSPSISTSDSSNSTSSLVSTEDVSSLFASDLLNSKSMTSKSLNTQELQLVREQSSRAINVFTDLLLGIEERPPPSEEHLFSTIFFRPKNRLQQHLRRRTTSGTLHITSTNNNNNNRHPSDNHYGTIINGNTPLRRALSTGDLYYTNDNDDSSSNSTLSSLLLQSKQSSLSSSSVGCSSSVPTTVTSTTNLNRTQSEPY